MVVQYLIPVNSSAVTACSLQYKSFTCNNYYIQYVASGTEQCVSWDFNTQDWTPSGCTTIVGEDGIVTCSCNHLTNFAVLVVS